MGHSMKGPSLGAIDTGSPQRRAVLTRNVVNMFDVATPEDREAGHAWYPKVHEAAAKGAHEIGISVHQASGLIAAVSPNMDWEKNNIGALGELGALSGKQWQSIQRSHEAGMRGEGTGKQGRGRLPETRNILAGVSVSAATDAALMKAHSILHGADYDEVMPRRDSPKTNSFAHNIEEPDRPGPVTVDGRAHDIAANRLQSWMDSGRGISSAALTSGKPTRYEHFEQAYRNAGAMRGVPLGHEMQAITWTAAKRREVSGTTKAGKPRQQGPTRAGQKYL